MLWFKLILGLMFFELVSINFYLALFQIYANEYITNKNKNWTSLKNFCIKTKFNPQHLFLPLLKVILGVEWEWKLTNWSSKSSKLLTVDFKFISWNLFQFFRFKYSWDGWLVFLLFISNECSFFCVPLGSFSVRTEWVFVGHNHRC